MDPAVEKIAEIIIETEEALDAMKGLRESPESEFSDPDFFKREFRDRKVIAYMDIRNVLVEHGILKPVNPDIYPGLT